MTRGVGEDRSQIPGEHGLGMHRREEMKELLMPLIILVVIYRGYLARQ